MLVLSLTSVVYVPLEGVAVSLEFGGVSLKFGGVSLKFGCVSLESVAYVSLEFGNVAYVPLKFRNLDDYVGKGMRHDVYVPHEDHVPHDIVL